jgi:hypothetical protein
LEVDVQQGNFKILRFLLQIHIFFWVEKWNPPTRSETAKIGPKTEGILGVKSVLQDSSKSIINYLNLVLEGSLEGPIYLRNMSS